MHVPSQVLHTRLFGFTCAAFGLRVTPCGRFQLRPRERAELTLSYAPDFTAATLSLSLITITAEQGLIRLPVVVSMPPDLLPALHDADPGTPTETTLRLVSTALVVTLGLWATKTLHQDFLTLDAARILHLGAQEGACVCVEAKLGERRG